MRHLAMPILSLALLAAAALPDMSGAQEAVISTRSAAFDDRDPVDFGRHAPHRYPVHGIDVARYQGTIDWSRAARASGLRETTGDGCVAGCVIAAPPSGSRPSGP